jgi:hypothetical protein
MNHRKLRSSLALLAATAGVTVFAASAQAVVIDTDPASVTGDPQGEATLTDANVAFDFTGGQMVPRLTGTLNADNADDLCIRVRLESYDGATFLHDKAGAKRCLNNDAHHEFSVDLSEDADALTDNVVVVVEKENAQGWSTADSRTIDQNIFDESLIVSGAGIDIGGPGFAAGNPTSPATVDFSLDQGLVSATYDGDLHFDGFSRCGRVKLRYLDEAGVELDKATGPQHCPPDLAHYAYYDVIASTPNALVTQVEVIMQSKSGGSWNKVDSETVSIEE